MRDFYDIFILMKLYDKDIDDQALSKAFKATSEKRNRAFEHISHQLENIAENSDMQNLWKHYQGKYPYAADTSFESVMESIKALVQKAGIKKLGAILLLLDIKNGDKIKLHFGLTPLEAKL